MIYDQNHDPPSWGPASKELVEKVRSISARRALNILTKHGKIGAKDRMGHGALLNRLMTYILRGDIKEDDLDE